MTHPAGPSAEPDSDSEGTEAAGSGSRRLISASAVMVAGTLVSRIFGFGRFVLLAVLFGNASRQADMFAVANTVPNSMYILLAGGVLNTVLVPQIVRAIRNDRDRGEAYTNRILTGGLIVLFMITLLLTLAVPVIINLYTAGGWKDPALAPQYHSMIALAYYCMPQVFFYGVHVLVGQVLNARDRFGPMMWAPIANNVVSIMVLLLFLVIFGQTRTSAPFTPGQELLLGLGSTLGIAVQAAVLIPYLRAVGFRFQPRVDFRGTGLGHTIRLAKWTLGFVLVTQAALVVINKVATGATVRGEGGGLAAYANAYAIWILPHSLITVSLATAMLPSASRLAAAGDLKATAAEVTRTIRLAVTALLPASVGLVVLGIPIARLVFGFGAGARDADLVGWALVAFAVGLGPFTVQYVGLRAFYAMENTRTPFFLQVAISGLNVVLGVAAVLLLDNNAAVAACLAGGFSLAYVVGAALTFRRLQRDLPDLALRPVVHLGTRLLLAVAPAALISGLGVWWMESREPSQLLRAVTIAVAGLVAVGLFVVAARALKLDEVTEIVGTVLRRGRADAPAASDPEAVPDPADPGDSTLVVGPGSPTVETASGAATPQLSAGLIENVDDMVASTQTERSSSEHALTPIVGADLGAAFHRSQVLAGEVLGRRYRLEELLAETPRTGTWRATDLVLSRSVLLHLFSPDDPGADELLALARQSAVATDSRFLRVLDAVPRQDETLGAYIVCEYAAGKSLELLLSHGPLTGLEAAWVVREVADAICGAHALGLHHERLSPDTVILTPDGHIKIVGLVIEAALRPEVGEPLPGAAGRSPAEQDAVDLGRLLYACLVSRWPGGPAFSLPAAPPAGAHWLSPRQVRAGVSPALDAISDQILGDPPRHHAERLTTAAGVAKALTRVLGSADASADLERRLRQPVPRVTSTPPAVGSHPISPLSADATRVTVVRHVSPTSAPDVHSSTGRRSRRWLVILLVMALLLIGTAVVAAAVLNRTPRTATPPTTGASSAPPSTQPTTAAGPVRIVAARAFDPQGDPPNDENGDEVARAYDGQTDTRWRTVTYLGNPKLGGLKRGVGLVLDLGQARTISAAKLQLSGTGTDVDVRIPATDPAGVSKPPMSSDKQWRVVAERNKARGTVSLTLPNGTSTRYVLVYLTSLPKEGNGYRGGIAEVSLS